MARLLYIEASPRKERSFSIRLARQFLDVYRRQHPNDEIYEIDLWKKDLPQFDGDVINAKYAILHQKEATKEEKRAWAPVEELIKEFKSGDKYLISTPMWNYGIPYRLKQYLDILIQPTYTFSFSPEKGYEGLIKGRPVVVVYARGGEYGEGAVEDFQRTYMEYILRYLGFRDIQAIVVEPTLGNKEQAVKRAEKRVQEVIRSF